jgi:cytochrome oxidase Cu insertion factor (SCO1/SenC/PrrC family)
MALRPAGGKAAPGFTLTDAATGAEVSLVELRSRAVVLTFSNAACNDICPVLATELHRAASLLGHTNVPVTFVTINTDPLDTAPGSARIVDQPLLSSMPDWKFLTGTIAQLNPVWRAYGISITVDEATRQVSHDNALYFVSPSGRLVWSATPFADESPDGVYTLPAAEIARFAKGIARYAGELADRP